MPMTGPPFLTDAEIGLFEQWIAAGMPVGGGKASPSSGGPDATGVAATSRQGPGKPVTFEQVAPIFATRCAKCHTDGGLMGAAPEGFRLTNYSETISTFDRVRVVPGNPLASELVRRIRGHARPRMPRDGPPYLSEDEMKLIEDWIRDGARNVGGKPAPNPAGARVRLHGTLGSGWLLDGLRLNVGGGTRIDKSPGPGDYVEVRGTVRADGGVDVERLRRR
jgi:mono/diheme cytochrome c family protein